MALRTLVFITAIIFALPAASAQERPAGSCVELPDPYGCAEAERTVPPNILALLSTYPRGEEGLSTAVYLAAIARPEDALPILVSANRADPGQILAVARGLLRALDELSNSGPQCQAGCSGWVGTIGNMRPWHRVTGRGDKAKCGPNAKVLPVEDFGQSCGGPIRAAMQCASPAVDSVLVAIARQIYATSTKQIAGHCKAPVYQGTHIFSGWSVPGGPPVSRN
jgi:hypothetical protein